MATKAAANAERIAAFGEFVADVESGAYPEARHVVTIDEAEYARFAAALEERAS